MSSATPRRRATSSWAAGLAALVLLAPAAGAQTNAWDFTDTQNGGRCNITGGNASTGIGNTYNCRTQPSGATPTLTVQAFGIAVATNANNRIVSAAAVSGPYGTSGIGVGTVAEGGNDATDPNHMMDNRGSNSDFLLLNFLGGAHNLRSVSFGYVPDDSDFQLLRWTGSNGPSLIGQTVSQMFASGWELVGTTNGGANPAGYSVNPGNLASQYWIIAAYNPALGTDANRDFADDEMKVLGVTASAAQVVPEPSTYMLLGTGIAALGLVARRRRTS
ncbi:MAG: exosortase-dependent surface protein XDP1 [Gemmatirosa sp.]